MGSEGEEESKKVVETSDGIDARRVFGDLCTVVNLWRGEELADGEELGHKWNRRMVPEVGFQAPETDTADDSGEESIADEEEEVKYEEDVEAANAHEQRRWPYWWQTTLKLFSRRWFHRVWVIQEVALARKATVLLGDCSISWEIIGLAAAILRTNFNRLIPTIHHHHTRQQLLEFRTGVMNAYFMYRLSRSQSFTDRMEVNFHELLVLTRAFNCQDDRDRVYGLLGLPYRQHDHIINNEQFVVPDYNKSASEVYCEVAEQILRQSNSLSLLSSIQRPIPRWWHDSDDFRSKSNTPLPSIDPNLPSWVPQWSFTETQSLAPFQSLRLSLNAVSPQPQPSTTFFKIPPPPSKSLHVRLAPCTTLHPVTHTSGISDAETDFYIPYWAYTNPATPNPPLPFSPSIRPSFHHTHLTTASLTQTLTPTDLTALAMTLTAGKDWSGAPITTAAGRNAHLADFIALLLQSGLLWTLDTDAAFGGYNTEGNQPREEDTYRGGYPRGDNRGYRFKRIMSEEMWAWVGGEAGGGCCGVEVE